MSISLPAALQSLLTIGGVNVETDASAAVTNLTVDYVAKTLSFTVKQGTTTGQAFVSGQYPPYYTFHINLLTGVWSVDGSALTGTLAGATLTNVQTIFLNLRNTTETFAVNQNLFPSATAPAWTSI
jgi:hypothetical protein